MTNNTSHAHLICGAGPVVALPHGGQQRHGVGELEQAGGEDWVQRGVCLGPEVAAPHGLDHAGAVLLPLPPQRARDRVVAGPVSLQQQCLLQSCPTRYQYVFLLTLNIIFRQIFHSKSREHVRI